ncbi:MAG: spore coat protein [Clostridia bacterium]|jgi:spore coat protein CotF|nr:spore coat protein [Clostridia bacterium]MDD4572543.1 spore coat protein [Clostridia bacterium]
MDDKMIAWDSLKDAKHLSEIYTGFATEVACEALLQDTIKIGQDHVRANHDIFNIMQKNGWYPTAMATQQSLLQAQNKAQQLSQGQ